MKSICAWLERFGEVINGVDALVHAAVWGRLFSLTRPRPWGIAGTDGLPPPLPRSERPQIMAAIGGIDSALWDIKGKHAGLRMWRLLGGYYSEAGLDRSSSRVTRAGRRSRGSGTPTISSD